MKNLNIYHRFDNKDTIVSNHVMTILSDDKELLAILYYGENDTDGEDSKQYTIYLYATRIRIVSENYSVEELIKDILTKDYNHIIIVNDENKIKTEKAITRLKFARADLVVKMRDYISTINSLEREL